MVSKADRIREMTRNGASPGEIADECDTSTSYVYKVRSSMDDEDDQDDQDDEVVNPDQLTEVDEGNDGTGSTEPEPDPEISESTDPEPDEGGNLDLDDDDPADEPEDLEAEDLTADDVDDSQDAEDLDLDDSGGKSYECGECNTSVDYLEKRCPDCGEQLMWSYIEAAE